MFLQMLNTFNTLPKNGIIVFLNEEDKTVYITMTRNFGALLERFKTKILKKIKRVTKVIIHEANTKQYIHRLFMRCYQNQYEEMGYTIIGKNNFLVYDVKIEIKDRSVAVTLVNARNEKIVVGLFNTTLEAFEFKDFYYNENTNPYNFPVFSCNHLTKVHYSVNMKQYDTRFEYTPPKK